MHGFTAKNKRILPNFYCRSFIFAFVSMMQCWLSGSMLAPCVGGPEIKSRCHQSFSLFFRTIIIHAICFISRGAYFIHKISKLHLFSSRFMIDLLRCITFQKHMQAFEKRYLIYVTLIHKNLKMLKSLSIMGSVSGLISTPDLSRIFKFHC